MSVIVGGAEVGFWISGSIQPYVTTKKPRTAGLPALNNSSGIAIIDPELISGTKSVIAADSYAIPFVPYIAAGPWSDFNLKLWVIPSVLQLSNPQLYSNIPFVLWNTWTDFETISGVTVDGSNVLTFDVGAGTVIRDNQYRVANFQIGAGEPSIEALAYFNTENTVGILNIIALISSTFNLIPDVPVTEQWEFLTDILVNHRGDEQRIALRRFPRLGQQFKVQILDVRQRREQYELLRNNIVVQALVPFYQYSTQVTGVTPIGGTEIFCDPKRTNMRVGEFLVAVNTSSEDTVLGRVEVIGPNSVTINTAVGFEVNPASWFVMPAFSCIIDDGSGITMSNVTGELKITANSFTEPTLVRPGATRAIGTFDGIPHLDRRPLITAAEDFNFRREIIDNKTGARDLNSRDRHPILTGDREFTIQRVSDPDEMDYWRSFFDTIRGAQKSFLLSTYFPDITLTGEHPPLGASQLTINEGTYGNTYQQYESWKRIEIEWNGNHTMRTQHTVTSVFLNEDGTALLGFTPALPLDPLYAEISLISFLMRVRSTDGVVLKHYANYSTISFGTFSTDT